MSSQAWCEPALETYLNTSWEPESGQSPIKLELPDALLDDLEHIQNFGLWD